MWTIEITKPRLPGETLEEAERRILSQDKDVLFMRPSLYLPTAVYKLEPQPDDEVARVLLRVEGPFGTRIGWLDDAGRILKYVQSGEAAEACKQIATYHAHDDQAEPGLKN